jgi:starch phosphorylase
MLDSANLNQPDVINGATEPAAPPQAEALAREASDFEASVVAHLIHSCAKEPSEASALHLYLALAHAVRDRLVQRWLSTQRAHADKDAKSVCYLSSEFLTGRSLGLCLMNLGLFQTAEQLASRQGFDLTNVLECEDDPGLGNGGLGRLAACVMDSLATLDLPAYGYGIRYDFGMFEQKLDDGWQVERHDDWLHFGNAWELPRYEDTQMVRLYGRVQFHRDELGRSRASWVDARSVTGVPFDSFIIGHRTDTVNTLRLWAARATRDFDFKFFNAGDYRRAVEEKIDTENISKVLYPNDQSEAGKELRLKQQYFFVACSIADIIKRYKRRHASFAEFPDKVAIQLNDTHPAIAVAELMRILVDEELLEWDEAWAITERTFGYTNHTLLPEALERWAVPLFERLLPRHLLIIYEINRRFLRMVQTHWPGEVSRLARMSIIEEGPVKHVRMAHLATVGAHSINGVAKLHTELLKTELLRDFWELWPERFNNKTNGVTPRRWMLSANPRLSQAITARIGSAWIDRDLSGLEALEDFAEDPDFLAELRSIKRANKLDLARLVWKRSGVGLSADSMFVVHVKRIHEYKRQLLACLGVVAHYMKLKRQPTADELPRSYIFAGKAAPGYSMAKLHIKLLNDVAAVVNTDPVVRNRLAMAFIPNYGASLAQIIIPGADLSVQISMAGTEASGTSNMKFALNGALTIGTLDGANVELRDAVGPDNFFLFGLTTSEIAARRGAGYRPMSYIAESSALSEALELIGSGFFSMGDRDRYRPIVDMLRGPDPYMVCADFDSYVECEARAAAAYRDAEAWSRRALFNVAGARRFSIDNTVRQYASQIWNIRPVSPEALTSVAVGGGSSRLAERRP